MRVGEVKSDGRVHRAGSSRGRPRKDPEEIHGNIRTYNRGCKCDMCMEASRLYSKSWRLQQKEAKQASRASTLKSPLEKLKERWASDAAV